MLSYEIRTDNKITTAGDRLITPQDARDIHDWELVPEKGETITVAVMDSGIDEEVAAEHPWFAEATLTKQFDATGRNGVGDDGVGHGTGCASIIANAVSEVELYDVRIFGASGASSGFGPIKKAYQWLLAKSDEIDVVNMSWGSQRDIPEINDLHDRLMDQGVYSVVAAGNCIPANSWVLTGKGWRRMHNVHKMGEGTEIISYENGKFVSDEVTASYKREMRSNEKLFRVKTNEGHVVEATEDHKFLTSNGYKKAKNLELGDEIITKPDSEKKVPDFYENQNPNEEGIDNAKGNHPSGNDHSQYKERVKVKCPNCGKEKHLVPHRAKKEEGFCNGKCVSEYYDLKPPETTTEEAKKRMPDDLPKIGEKTLKEWRKENPKEFARFSKNKEFVKNQGDASKLPHNEKVARKGAAAAHKSMENSKTSIEKKIENMLNQINVDYDDEHIICKKDGGMLTAIDFAIPERKIAIYADGNYWHNYPNETDTDERITKTLEERGWKVIRFWESEINENTQNTKQKLAKEIMNGATVTEIEEIDQKTVYDVSVKNNHNFVTNGLVVHNSGSDGGSPATAREAFSTGAIDENESPTRFSSFDPDKGNPDVAAVGQNVMMARANGTAMGTPLSDRYVKSSGTSFAAPYVTAAYVNALYRKRQKWHDQFMNTADDVPGTPKDGGGVVRLQEALSIKKE
jgi:intein/homing endonuclease